MSCWRTNIAAASALALSVTIISGCDGAQRAARVRQPALTPQSSIGQTATAAPSGPPASLPMSSMADLSSLQPAPLSAVDVLIAHVQATYDAGERAYSAGDLDAARKDFKSALDQLMKTGSESTRDPRLQVLFSHILDTMQSYEMKAEEQDDTADDNSDSSDTGDNTTDADDSQSQAPPSTAPIEEIADMEDLPATDPRLAATAEKELITVPHDLPLTVNASVLQYLSFFASPRGREIVEAGLQRAGRYRTMIESTLKQEGLPLDLIYLAQAESAFKPSAISSKGASGIWQFMPYRGKEYGLDRNYWVDERDDPIAATRAAAEHLRDLYATFGDWYLVMAAYNSGPLNVARAIERTGYADFWDLQKLNALPAQTRNYVPIILALEMVAKDPALYGIHVDPDAPAKYDLVKLGHSISLQLVSDATDTSVSDLKILNPALIRGITPEDPNFALHVTDGTAAELQKAIAPIPHEKWTSWRLAALGSGDTLASLAREYHVKLASLENVNVIDGTAPLPAGTKLIIPAAPPRLRLVHYRVRRGESLASIATRFSVSVPELKRWNHLRSDRAPRGRLLRIYENYYPSEGISHAGSRSARRDHESALVETGDHRLQHRVKPGETLWSIAHEYGITVDALKDANPFLDTRGLQAGDHLSIVSRQ